MHIGDKLGFYMEIKGNSFNNDLSRSMVFTCNISTWRLKEAESHQQFEAMNWKAQCLRVYATLAEDQSFIYSIHMAAHNFLLLQFQRIQ